MKLLPMVAHAISFILRSGGTSDLTSGDLQRSMTLNYQNIDVSHHFSMNDMMIMHGTYIILCKQGLLIIDRALDLNSENNERSMTSKYQNMNI